MEYVRNWLYKASILLIISTHTVKGLLTFSPQAPIFTGRSCYFLSCPDWTIDLKCVHFLHCELWTDAESAHFLSQSSFFQNEEIFVELDELDELDRITHDMDRIQL